MAYKAGRIVTHNKENFKTMCEALKKSEHVKWHYETLGSMYAKDRRTPGNTVFYWENKVTDEKGTIRYEKK